MILRMLGVNSGELKVKELHLTQVPPGKYRDDGKSEDEGFDMSVNVENETREAFGKTIIA